MSIQQKEKNMAAAGNSMADSAKDAAGKVGDAVKDAASNVANKTSEAGSYVANKTSEAGSYVAKKAEVATAAVGGELKSVADTIREKGPQDGMLGNASTAVANSLESYGRELQEHGLTGIADDITNTVRRHPIPAVLIGIGLGFMLARVVSR